MPVIEVTDLHKRYRDQVAVADVSFTVEQGEIFGILGPNGAGKTTTVESLAGLRIPGSGSITVLGFDPRRDREELRQHVGVQLQESELPDKITVAEALELYASFYRRPADWPELLDRLGLVAKRDTAYKKLSGGQKQRLAIALALIGSPRIAILDELTTGLDPEARRGVWGLIEDVRAGGVTVVLVTHLMEEAQRLCDRVAVIDSGHVVAVDSPGGLAATVDAEQHIRFRTAHPLDERLLTGLPEVTGVRMTGSHVAVTGTGDVLAAVTSMLARHGVVAEQLRVDQASLDDAYLALTGRPLDATRN